jgi:hypothetical protein
MTQADIRRMMPPGPREGQKYQRRPADDRAPAPDQYKIAVQAQVHLPKLSVTGKPQVRITKLGPCDAVELQVGGFCLTVLCAQREGEMLAEELMRAFGSPSVYDAQPQTRRR